MSKINAIVITVLNRMNISRVICSSSILYEVTMNIGSGQARAPVPDHHLIYHVTQHTVRVHRMEVATMGNQVLAHKDGVLTHEFGTEVEGQLERSTLGRIHLVAEWGYRHNLVENSIDGCSGVTPHKSRA